MGCYAGDIENHGSPSELMVWEQLFNVYKNNNNVIFGYKDPSLGKNIDETPSFILLHKTKGIILLDVIDNEFHNVDCNDDDFWHFENDNVSYSRLEINRKFMYEIESRFKQNRALRKEYEDSHISIKSFIIFSKNEEEVDIEEDSKFIYLYKNNIENIDKYIEKLDNKILNDSLYNEIVSELDSTNILSKNINRPKVYELKTMNDYIQKSLEYTFKLDENQRQLAKQIPAGPQRIRGLAGTGKTVILCMKAAIAHKMDSNNKILFVFNTKSMINEIKGYISKYYEKEVKRGVNWNNLEVLHAWGGADLEGLYSKTCKNIGIARLSFSDVGRSKDGLEIIYNDLLKNKEKISPIYDLVLIDEAQDFPPSFFETIYYLTKEPKRIIWAYDEFQSLKDIKILEPEEMFGKNEKGIYNLSNNAIKGFYMGEIKKDYALKNSYRNPGFNLMVAHSLALGLHRENGIIDTLPDRNSWEAIGYNVEQPSHDIFQENDQMVISRPQGTCKNILSTLLSENHIEEKSLITFKCYNSQEEEIMGVADKINFLIHEQSIEPSQIFVITLNTKSSKDILKCLRNVLMEKYEIKSIMPGYEYDTGSSFREDGYITLTTPWKAKGNESNIVFVLNAQKAYTDTTFKTRNALFVSITRSRGWCYISGIGMALSELEKETKHIIDNKMKFIFSYPKEETLNMNRKRLLKNDNKEELVDEFIENNHDLLVEKLKNDPDLWNKLKDELDNHKGI